MICFSRSNSQSTLQLCVCRRIRSPNLVHNFLNKRRRCRHTQPPSWSLLLLAGITDNYRHKPAYKLLQLLL
ncbi:hypothetical protein HanIR_Chr08g0371491 [Helianthus annuus]|nr:hypothetical protein HanIR_Chr08g0371491 [Helianthus annuus]